MTCVDNKVGSGIIPFSNLAKLRLVVTVWLDQDKDISKFAMLGLVVTIWSGRGFPIFNNCQVKTCNDNMVRSGLRHFQNLPSRDFW